MSTPRYLVIGEKKTAHRCIPIKYENASDIVSSKAKLKKILPEYRKAKIYVIGWLGEWEYDGGKIKKEDFTLLNLYK